MKKSLLLLTFFTCLSFVGWAKVNPTTDNGDEEIDPEPKEWYTFSISKTYLALFNLFSVQASEPDSLHFRAPFLKDLPDPENAPQ